MSLPHASYCDILETKGSLHGFIGVSPRKVGSEGTSHKEGKPGRGFDVAETSHDVLDILSGRLD